MKFFLTILSVLIFNAANTQITPELLFSKANDFQYKEQKADSVLKYYQEIRQSFPHYSETYILYLIAKSYLEIGDTSQAENYFLKSMQIDNKSDSLDFGLGKHSSCLELAELYYKQKKYRKALSYFDSTKKEHKRLKTLCQGGYGPTSQLIFQYKKAVCYYGINIKDSAIISLAPYIFEPPDYDYIDSLEYDTISKFFVSTVFELYGKKNAKKRMNKAIKNIIYMQAIQEEPGSMFKWLNVDCSISYLGTKISLVDSGQFGLTKSDSFPNYLTKEFLLQEFTESPSYKMIFEK